MPPDETSRDEADNETIEGAIDALMNVVESLRTIAPEQWETTFLRRLKEKVDREFDNPMRDDPMSSKPGKTATYVVACTTPKGTVFFRTVRHRWCIPMAGVNDYLWLKCGSRKEASDYIAAHDFSAMDDETRNPVRVEEIWL